MTRRPIKLPENHRDPPVIRFMDFLFDHALAMFFVILIAFVFMVAGSKNCFGQAFPSPIPRKATSIVEVPSDLPLVIGDVSCTWVSAAAEMRCVLPDGSAWVFNSSSGNGDVVFLADDGSEILRTDASAGRAVAGSVLFPDDKPVIYGTGLDARVYFDGNNLQCFGPVSAATEHNKGFRDSDTIFYDANGRKILVIDGGTGKISALDLIATGPGGIILSVDYASEGVYVGTGTAISTFTVGETFSASATASVVHIPGDVPVGFGSGGQFTIKYNSSTSTLELNAEEKNRNLKIGSASSGEPALQLDADGSGGAGAWGINGTPKSGKSLTIYPQVALDGVYIDGGASSSRLLMTHSGLPGSRPGFQVDDFGILGINGAVDCGSSNLTAASSLNVLGTRCLSRVSGSTPINYMRIDNHGGGGATRTIYAVTDVILNHNTGSVPSGYGSLFLANATDAYLSATSIIQFMLEYTGSTGVWREVSRSGPDIVSRMTESIVASIDLKVEDATPIYTVPTGFVFMLIDVIVLMETTPGTPTPPTVGVGITGAPTNYVTGAVLTGLDAAPEFVNLANSGAFPVHVIYSGGDQIDFNVEAGATSVTGNYLATVIFHGLLSEQ